MAFKLIVVTGGEGGWRVSMTDFESNGAAQVAAEWLRGRHSNEFQAVVIYDRPGGVGRILPKEES